MGIFTDTEFDLSALPEGSRILDAGCVLHVSASCRELAGGSLLPERARGIEEFCGRCFSSTTIGTVEGRFALLMSMLGSIVGDGGTVRNLDGMTFKLIQTKAPAGAPLHEAVVALVAAEAAAKNQIDTWATGREGRAYLDLGAAVARTCDLRVGSSTTKALAEATDLSTFRHAFMASAAHRDVAPKARLGQLQRELGRQEHPGIIVARGIRNLRDGAGPYSAGTKNERLRSAFEAHFPGDAITLPGRYRQLAQQFELEPVWVTGEPAAVVETTLQLVRDGDQAPGAALVMARALA